jgi:DNA-binding SARP family transcriptional activator
MKVSILGPLEVLDHGISIVPTANKPRQVLALLVTNAGKLVTAASLIEEMWGMNAPRSALPTVHTYIMRLRQLIDEARPANAAGAAKDVLVTRPGGYTLDIETDDVDLHRYQKLATAGERALEANDYESASRLLSSALDEWRGPALIDVQVGPQLDLTVTRLTQSRLGVQESRIHADLRLGRHHRLLGELAELTSRYPLHEKLCALYMNALSSSGCNWRALEVFQSLRHALIDELGVEPSVRMQYLQHTILNSDQNHPGNNLDSELITAS